MLKKTLYRKREILSKGLLILPSANGGIKMEIKLLAENKLEKLKHTENRHRLLKDETLSSVVSIEAEMLKAARHYFDNFGFTEVVVPHITKATGACENIDTMFALDYFGERSYLVQTGQLYLEALIQRLGNVYCIGPSFRAEPDVDNRHVTEFTLIELELACNFEELLAHIETIVHAMIHRVAQNKKQELENIGIDRKRLLSTKLPFVRINYTDAIEILQSLDVNVSWGDDLKSIHEKKIVEYFKNMPTFITHYPEAIKFFNMKRNAHDEKIVNSADLILPYSGECAGSAEREHDYNALVEKLGKSNMLRMLEKRGGSIEDFRWYLDHVKDGIEPHSGCGIGLNRVVQFVLGTDDIRACTAYPLNRESLM